MTSKIHFYHAEARLSGKPLASYDLSLGQVLRAKPTQKPLSPALFKLIRIPKKVSWCRGLFGHKAAGMES